MRTKVWHLTCVLILLFVGSCQIHGSKKELKEGDIAILESRVCLLSVAGPNGHVLDYVDKGEPVYITSKSKNKITMDGRTEYWYEVINISASIGWIEGNYLQRQGALPSFAKDLVYGYGDVRVRAIESMKALDETRKKGVSLYLMERLLNGQGKLYPEQSNRAAEAISILGPAPERLVKNLMVSYCEFLASYNGPDAGFPEAEVFGKLGPSAGPVVIKFLQSPKRTDHYCAFDAIKHMDPKTPGLVRALSDLLLSLKKQGGAGDTDWINQSKIIHQIFDKWGLKPEALS